MKYQIHNCALKEWRKMMLLFRYFVSVLLLYAPHVFAETQNVEITFSPDAVAAKKINPVKLLFQGNIYKERPIFNKAKVSELNITPAETFIIKYIEVNTSGTQGQILEMWNPAEKDVVEKMISSKENFDRNRAFYSAIIESRFVAQVHYGSFVLFYIEHFSHSFGYKVKLYPLMKSGKNYYITNALEHDYFYNRIASNLETYFDRSSSKK